MYAQKGNKVYSVTEQTKTQYLADGFDIVDDNGRIIDVAPNKTVSYAEYKRVVDENAKLTAEIKKLKKVSTGVEK